MKVNGVDYSKPVMIAHQCSICGDLFKGLGTKQELKPCPDCIAEHETGWGEEREADNGTV